MNYQVTVSILNRGFLVTDGNHTHACNDGKELINCLTRIKSVVETEQDYEDEDEHD